MIDEMELETKIGNMWIELEGVALKGDLSIPADSVGLIVFSHGSGSSRLSPRNRYVAQILNRHGLATLLFDLLTESEDLIYSNRFDIDLLTKRLVEVTQWARENAQSRELPIAYFGASTGASSALKAAAILGDEIRSVVSRGGRPDLAMENLHQVLAPTLLLVGDRDQVVLDLNSKALTRLNESSKLKVIEGASHLFEEPGKLEEVAEKSARWFIENFKGEI